MLPVEKSYICCDMKSFYASVECVARGLDPLKTRLLVADEMRENRVVVTVTYLVQCTDENSYNQSASFISICGIP